jgi:succinyl-CoA synthetase beta subunit
MDGNTMLMLEHQAKGLLRFVGIETPLGETRKPGERRPWSGAYPVAVKAQVPSGGRGKRGGVIRADDAKQLERAVGEIFGTSISGQTPSMILLEPWVPIRRELYLSLAVDAQADGYVLLYAPKGGVDIEDGPLPTAYRFGAPEAFRVHEFRAVLEGCEDDYRVREKIVVLGERLVATAAAHDCTTIEINPLALLEDDSLVALDAKIARDEWATFRNAEIKNLVDEEHARADPYLRASLEMKHMYVRLDGDIGLISGGAGMTMAAMDMIAAQGGRPACFLDASPGPTSTRGYRPAIAMLDADPAVKVILVSIFGGGTQMQRVAKAMKELMPERTTSKPLVFRLDGTNVHEVPEILATFGARNCDTLEQAVAEAVHLARSAP